MEYTAIVKRSGEWWIGWIEEVPGVNCQERTHDDSARVSPKPFPKLWNSIVARLAPLPVTTTARKKLPWHEADPIAEASSAEWVHIDSGRKKTSWWCNNRGDRRSAIPRHREIDDTLARKICRDLGIEPIK